MLDCVQIELACPQGSAFAASTRAALRRCESRKVPTSCQRGSAPRPRVTELRIDAERTLGDTFIHVVDSRFTLSAHSTAAGAS